MTHFCVDVISHLPICHMIRKKSDTTGATSGGGTVHLSRTPNMLCGVHVAQSLVFSVVCFDHYCFISFSHCSV